MTRSCCKQPRKFSSGCVSLSWGFKKVLRRLRISVELSRRAYKIKFLSWISTFTGKNYAISQINKILQSHNFHTSSTLSWLCFKTSNIVNFITGELEGEEFILPPFQFIWMIPHVLFMYTVYDHNTRWLRDDDG